MTDFIKDTCTSFDEKVAIVTGSGRGIGRAIAHALAREGFNLGVADIDESTASEVAAEVRSFGRKAVHLRVNVAKKEEMQEAVADVLKKLGRVDVMVNNAGVGHIKPFLEITEGEWDHVLEINLKGVLFGIQAAASAMIDLKSPGRIVNIASVAGKGGRPLLAAYAASKAAVINLSQSAAYALAPHGITVNCICPGVVPSAMGKEALAKMKEYTDTGRVPSDESRVPSAPLGPEASPEDIARMVVYLVGSGGNYITGQAINVDGGRCMH